MEDLTHINPEQLPFPEIQYAGTDGFDPYKLFERTILGQIIEEFKKCERPMNAKEIARSLQNKENLRRTDGSRYSGNIDRAVTGCMQQNSMFHFQSGLWVLDFSQLSLGIEKQIKVIQGRKLRSVNAKAARHRPKTIASHRHARMVCYLDQQIRGGKSDPKFESLYQNPFLGIKDTDTGEDIVRKIGFEKALGIAQAYEIVKRNYTSIYEETAERSQTTTFEKTVAGIIDTAARIRKELME